VGAVAVGLIESLATGYLDPHVGGGFGSIASCFLLVAMLFLRPYGLYGRPKAERV